MKRLLSILLTVAMLLGLVVLPGGALAADAYATVEGGWLRLRDNASFDARTLTSYNVGTVVEILDTKGDWYKVKTPDGTVGYMYSKYLGRSGGYVPLGAGGTAYVGDATIISANGYGVRLRSGPNTTYRILRKYPVGTRASILEQGRYWSRISVGGLTGYMMNQFLSKDGGGVCPPNPSYAGDATVWSANGLGVRLRTGPGTSYRKIGVYSVGTQVTILEKGGTWDYIRIGSRVGYMMNKFLIYNNNYQVKGVTINNYSPVVGNILSVQTVNPSCATVTFQWYADKEKRGTEASYTVTSADVGKQMRLVVTGVGCYTGTAYTDPTAAVVGSGTVTAVSLNTTKPYVGNILRIGSITPAGATVSYQWKDASNNAVLSTADNYPITDDDVAKNRRIYLAVTGINTYNGTVTSDTTDPAKAAAAPTILTQSLPSATKEAGYSATLQAVGGGASFTWTRVSGDLPAGLSLNSATGVISGTVAADAKTSTVVFKVSNGIAPDAQVSLTITVQGRVSAPVLEPAGGKYNEGKSIKMTCATAGAAIYYTTDGTEPSKQSQRYTSSIFLGVNATVKAIAIADGMTESPVTAQTYEFTRVDIPFFEKPYPGAYTTANKPVVTLNCNTAGATIHYTVDGSEPTASSPKYEQPITLKDNAATLIRFIAVKEGLSPSYEERGTYTISDKDTYKFVYVKNGGAFFGTYPLEYKVGVGAPLPTNIRKDNFKFAGWYADEACEKNPVSGISSGDTGEKTVFAKWTPATTRGLQFDMQGGSIADPPTSYVAGETMPLPTTGITPPSTHDVFNGWWSDSATASPVTHVSETETRDPAIFYAQWKEAQSYGIYYVVNGIEDTSGTPSEFYKGETPNLWVPSDPRYDYSGWYLSGDCTGTPITKVPDGWDKILTVFCTRTSKTKTITLNANGGIPGSVTTVTAVFGQLLPTIAQAGLPTMPATAAAGTSALSFAGYYDTAEGPGTMYYNAGGYGDTPWDQDRDAILYARWTDVGVGNAAASDSGSIPGGGQSQPGAPGPFTVTYNLNNGTGAAPVDTKQYASGEKVVLPDGTGMSYEGHDFIGWNLAMDGTDVGGDPGFEYTVTGNVTFYAQWAVTAGESGDPGAPANDGIMTLNYDPNVTFKLTYHGNNETPIEADSFFASGAEVTVPDIGLLTYEGHTFTGWNTAADGSGEGYAVGRTFNMADNLDLYAQWKLNENVQISGDGQQPSEEVPQQPSEEVPQQPSEETPQQPSEEVPQQPSEETPQQPSEEVPQQPSEEVPQQPSEEVPQQPSEEVPQQPSEEAPQQPSEEVPQQPSEEVPQQPSEEAPQQPSSEPEVPTAPVSFTVNFYDGSNLIASVPCVSGESVVLPAYPTKTVALWNTNADGSGAVYETQNTVVISADTSFYYMGAKETPQEKKPVPAETVKKTDPPAEPKSEAPTQESIEPAADVAVASAPATVEEKLPWE